jgi:hypothetical protein
LSVGSDEFGNLSLIGDHSATIADYLIEGQNILAAQQDLNEVRGTHDACAARAPPAQLSSRACVVTHSTCSPNRFM